MHAPRECRHCVEPLRPEGAEIAAEVGIDVAVLHDNGPTPVPFRYLQDRAEPRPAAAGTDEAIPIACRLRMVHPPVRIRVSPLRHGRGAAQRIRMRPSGVWACNPASTTDRGASRYASRSCCGSAFVASSRSVTIRMSSEVDGFMGDLNCSAGFGLWRGTLAPSEAAVERCRSTLHEVFVSGSI